MFSIKRALYVTCFISYIVGVGGTFFNLGMIARFNITKKDNAATLTTTQLVAIQKDIDDCKSNSIPFAIVGAIAAIASIKVGEDRLKTLEQEAEISE
jgi:hypothetical protein